MKDPFEADVEEQDSPPESPAPPEDEPGPAGPAEDPEDYDGGPPPRQPSAPASHAAAAGAKAKARVHREQQEDDDDEEDQIEVDLEKLPSSTGDPDKLAKMKFVLEYALPVQFLDIASDTALLYVQIRWFFVIGIILSVDMRLGRTASQRTLILTLLTTRLITSSLLFIFRNPSCAFLDKYKQISQSLDQQVGEPLLYFC
jgi:hypothetical protein